MANLILILNELASDLPQIEPQLLLEKVQSGTDGLADIAYEDTLTLAAETAASLVTHHPSWSILAGRLLVELIYLNTPQKFNEMIQLNRSMLKPEIVEFVAAHAEQLDAAIDETQDRDFSFFAIRTLQRSYLLKNERPQYLWMRVACAIHFPDLESVLETYSLMSKRYFTHATPTLFNAGLLKGQLASCFLLGMRGSSVGDVFDTLKDCALISHSAGGIGLHCSNVGSVSDTEGGLVPMLRVFNNASRYVSQGVNKRPGAISITLEPWHAEVFEFLDLKKNHGKEEYRARDLFYALWIPDLFMEKVLSNEDWYLFSPTAAPGLQDCYGAAFKQLYESYVAEKRYQTVIPARKLWDRILETQIETGNPSLLYKDSCNARSNQQNLGTIKSSNLCTEIVEYSSQDEIAVCNLASIALPAFVVGGKTFDYQRLHKVAKIITRNLNKCIDRTSYPLPECERSNLRNRPLAMGVQGLADVYFMLKLAFDSPEAAEINQKIFETIYHAGIESSSELAKEIGETYPSYSGSPMSKGKLQLDFWPAIDNLHWDWQALRRKVAEHGVYNSLVTAVMPTASTAQILGYTESVEPIMSNIFSRRTISGEFQLVNHYLVKELENIGLWNDLMRQELMAHRGSVQLIERIPSDIKRRFKTAFELSMKTVIQQSTDRAPFIDQSQSMNLFLSRPTTKQLTSMHFFAWKQGLKTGIYYLRTQPAADPIPFTINPEIRDSAEASRMASREASADTSFEKKRKREEQICDVCSS